MLRGLGLEVIHEDTDFFTNTYDFDYICTNPPFSKLKQIFAELKAIGKPFVVLCPCTTLTTKYFVVLEGVVDMGLGPGWLPWEVR